MEIDDTEAHRTGNGGDSNVLVLRGGGAPVEDPRLEWRLEWYW